MTRQAPLPSVPVLWAQDLSALRGYQGSYVEVVGYVASVVFRDTNDGKPYTFINFGDWKKDSFRVVLWSEALACFLQHDLDPKVFERQWISVRGVLNTYRQTLQITPTDPTQITKFSSEAAAEQYYEDKNRTPLPDARPPIKGETGPTIVLPPPPPPLVCSFCVQPIRNEAQICGRCGAPRHPPTRHHPGHLLNARYTIKRALFRGGMGEIYLALDSNVFDRYVVIKIMLDYFDAHDVAEVQAAQQMFEREARTLANLSHPAIPKIYDFFRVGFDAYIVMEHIAGDNLEKQLTHADLANRHIGGQPYSIETGIRIGIEVAHVLHYLATIKSGAVVHHDIKPANLLLDPTGMIRLVDFGTARPRVAAKGSTNNARQTTSYGTPGYAPPEQYQGQTDPRSDVYALAATIYHLVTDDDPREHPLSFPRLGTLGELGQVLKVALNQRIENRLDAQAFAARLQQLGNTDKVAKEEAEQKRKELEEEARREKEQRILRSAPDGTLLVSAVHLVKWAENNWQRTVAWLADEKRFLQQVGVICGTVHESTLRFIMGESNKNLVLDRILAQLDPSGFGMEQPQIAIDKTKTDLNFGFLKPAKDHSVVIKMTNTSRRYLQLNIVGPAWLRVCNLPIGFLPGEERAVTFIARADTHNLSNIATNSVDNVDFCVNGGLKILRMRVTARISVIDELRHFFR